jgi:hypothetical protein
MQCEPPHCPRSSHIPLQHCDGALHEISAPAAVLFQKKTPEASTDEELEGLLRDLELLAKLEDE